MEFIGREYEISHLEKEYAAKGSRFVVIYGRRRVGKTTLIERFIEKKDSAYYLAAEEKDFQQIEEFKKLLSRSFNDEFLGSNTFADWKDLFSYLGKVWPKERRMVLAIDEVTFIIRSNPSFPSYLQKFWDETLSRSNTFLILSGSLVGIILGSVLSESSPLYGRRTSQMLLLPYNLRDAIKFMRGFGFEDKLRFYGAIGGVAKYLTLVKDSDSFAGFLEDKFFTKEGFFYPEGLFLISQEVKEVSTYVDIMKAISFGYTKLSEIASFCGHEPKKTSSYLDILVTLGLVKRMVPVTENEKKFRGGTYEINDPYLRFWHRFIYPNRSRIEMRQGKEAMKEAMPEIRAYMGRVFERICIEYAQSELSGSFQKFGKWWGDTYDKQEKKSLAVEIDIVAINEVESTVLFGECKWQDDADAAGILTILREKASHVEWRKDIRKERYMIFAKSFKKKIEEKDVVLIDLKAMEKAFSG